MNDNYDSDIIEVELREIDLIFSQSHTRMQIISQLTNFSVTLAAAFLGIFVVLKSGGAHIPIFWFMIIPLPSFVFAFLILREDLLMAAHDRYFYSVRKRLIARLNCPESEPVLMFLPTIKKTKLGLLGTLLSGLRYGPAVFILFPSVYYFLSNSTVERTTDSYINAGLFVLNILLFCVLLLGIGRLGSMHNKNEKLIASLKK